MLCAVAFIHSFHFFWVLLTLCPSASNNKRIYGRSSQHVKNALLSCITSSHFNSFYYNLNTCIQINDRHYCLSMRPSTSNRNFTYIQAHTKKVAFVFKIIMTFRCKHDESRNHIFIDASACLCPLHKSHLHLKCPQCSTIEKLSFICTC